jgi:cytochrome c oxidase subunit 1
VAHLHYVLFGGSLFAIFAAITFWYPKMFGRMMGVGLGKAHFFLTFIFYNLVFFPMHQLGLHGHMRRIYDPTIYDFLKPLAGLNRFISISAFLLFASQMIFLVNFIGSWFRGRKAERNPWDDTGLEWTTPSPPPHGNWAVTPRVYQRPYEFGSDRTAEDFVPQDRKLDPLATPASAPANR